MKRTEPVLRRLLWLPTLSFVELWCRPPGAGRLLAASSLPLLVAVSVVEARRPPVWLSCELARLWSKLSLSFEFEPNQSIEPTALSFELEWLGGVGMKSTISNMGIGACVPGDRGVTSEEA